MPSSTRLLSGLVASFLFLLAGCGGKTVGLKVTFPDEGARAAVDSIAVSLLAPASTSGCAALLDGTAKPGDPGYLVEDEVEFGWPLSGQAPEKLKVGGGGRRLFFAEAGAGGYALLHGCSEVEDAQGGGGTVTVALLWIGEEGCEEGLACLAGWYCHPTIHRCLPCTSGDPEHCGSSCLDCAAQATDKACVDGTCGCNSSADCAAGMICDAGHSCIVTDGGLPDGDQGGGGDGCVPDCAGRCGSADDGCGGTCETPCLSGQYCQGTSCTVCNQPQHCGQLCLDCTAQATNKDCVNGQCGCNDDEDCPTSTCDTGSGQCNCIPDCAGRVCGPDLTGCGACGVCAGPMVCVADGSCCTPTCVGLCGGASDGCGGTCYGTCADGQWCNNQVCQDCASDDPSHCGPSCLNCAGQVDNRACIGGFCGCTSDQDCAAGKDCVAAHCGCEPDCTGRCGGYSDGCGGVCFNPCLDGQFCDAGFCMDCIYQDHCGPGCESCTGSSAGSQCVFDYQTSMIYCGCRSARDCASGKTCNVSDNLCYANPCIPACAGKNCDEDDGCGALCACEAGNYCNGSTCSPCSVPARCGAGCVDCARTTQPGCVDPTPGTFACGCFSDNDCTASGYSRCASGGYHCVP